jgi:predicted MFS family arabinose efflux permease
VLVLAKSYHVAKSAIVPTVVHSDAELVEANSRLSFLSGVVTFAAAIPGGLAFAIGSTFDSGSQAVLVLAVIVFATGALLGIRIPATKVVVDDTSETEREELRGGGILLAASAMGLLRGVVGFLTFLVAFALRSSDAPTYQFGLVVAASGVGSLLGSLFAPMLRRAGSSEERILLIVLGLTAVAGLLSAWAGGIAAAAGLALFVGIAASSGKLAFDSVVQRDAPDANRGRSFARFETRFQLTWVAGAFVPVVVTIPLEIGFLVVAACAGFALFSYFAGLRRLARGQVPVRRKPADAITSRLRRRRQGFAVGPDTPASPSPALAEADAGGSVSISTVGAVSPEADTEADVEADVDADVGAGVDADVEVDHDASGGDTRDDDSSAGPTPPPAPTLFDDASHAGTEPPHDRRVVIDPTNL